MNVMMESWVGVAIACVLLMAVFAECAFLYALWRMVKKIAQFAALGPDAVNELEALRLRDSEHRRLICEMANAMYPDGQGPVAPSMCDLVQEAASLREESGIARTCCDAPGDRMYHAADRTWWKRVENSWVRARAPRRS